MSFGLHGSSTEVVANRQTLHRNCKPLQKYLPCGPVGPTLGRPELLATALEPSHTGHKWHTTDVEDLAWVRRRRRVRRGRVFGDDPKLARRVAARRAAEQDSKVATTHADV